MHIILIPLGMLFLYWLQCRIFRKQWKDDLDVELTFKNLPVTEGEESELTEVITNRKFLPLPILKVGYQFNNGLLVDEAGSQSITDHTNIIDVFSMAPYQKITRQLKVTCAKRGCYQILRTSLTGSDLFSTKQYYSNREQNTQLYVYPRLINDRRLELPYEILMGEIKSKQFLFEDVFAFRGIRDYTENDPMTRVNWKASAKTGSLKVNLHDYTSGQQVLILLNVEDPAILFDSELLEDCIRLSATIASRMVGEHVPVGLITNGRDILTQQKIILKPGASASHLRSICEGLARIDLQQKKESFAQILEEQVRLGNPDNVTYCMISSGRTDEVILRAQELAKMTGRLLWLCPLTADMRDKEVGDTIDFVRLNHTDK